MDQDNPRRPLKIDHGGPHASGGGRIRQNFLGGGPVFFGSELETGLWGGVFGRCGAGGAWARPGCWSLVAMVLGRCVP